MSEREICRGHVIDLWSLRGASRHRRILAIARVGREVRTGVSEAVLSGRFGAQAAEVSDGL